MGTASSSSAFTLAKYTVRQCLLPKERTPGPITEPLHASLRGNEAEDEATQKQQQKQGLKASPLPVNFTEVVEVLYGEPSLYVKRSANVLFAVIYAFVTHEDRRGYLFSAEKITSPEEQAAAFTNVIKNILAKSSHGEKVKIFTSKKGHQLVSPATASILEVFLNYRDLSLVSSDRSTSKKHENMMVEENVLHFCVKNIDVVPLEVLKMLLDTVNADGPYLLASYKCFKTLYFSRVNTAAPKPTRVYSSLPIIAVLTCLSRRMFLNVVHDPDREFNRDRRVMAKISPDDALKLMSLLLDYEFDFSLPENGNDDTLPAVKPNILHYLCRSDSFGDNEQLNGGTEEYTNESKETATKILEMLMSSSRITPKMYEKDLFPRNGFGTPRYTFLQLAAKFASSSFVSELIVNKLYQRSDGEYGKSEDAENGADFKTALAIACGREWTDDKSSLVKEQRGTSDEEICKIVSSILLAAEKKEHVEAVKKQSFTLELSGNHQSQKKDAPPMSCMDLAVYRKNMPVQKVLAANGF